MTDVQKKLIRRTTMAIAAIGLLIPVTVSPTQGIQGNEACADGSCCREMLSVCLKDGTSTTHYYQSSDGVCTATDVG
ncbi:MAG TPA: hypothetical protein VMM12_08785 [Longimicrobiales bacterium]|nr:hypothetical protein [Longimicrobiales bacterium]